MDKDQKLWDLSIRKTPWHVLFRKKCINVKTFWWEWDPGVLIMALLAWMYVSLFPMVSFCVIPDEQRLLEKVLTNYNSAARPVFNASKVVLVKFGITLAQISDMVRYWPFYSLICSFYSGTCEKNPGWTEIVAKNLKRLWHRGPSRVQCQSHHNGQVWTDAYTAGGHGKYMCTKSRQGNHTLA